MIMLLLSLLATITFPSTKTCAFQIFPPQFHQLMSPQHNYAANTNNGSNWYSIKHRTRHYSTNCDAAAKLNNSRETDHRNEELSNKEITNQSTDVPEILKILKQTYPESSNTMDDNNSSATERWIKTRTYLYQYRARTSKHSSNDFDSKANTSAKKSTKWRSSDNPTCSANYFIPSRLVSKSIGIAGENIAKISSYFESVSFN